MNGFLLIDKPEGMTSMDVVRRVRSAVRTRRVGHTGTLDPMATGLLPVTIGACTKFPKFLELDPKVYTFDIAFGVETDSGDVEGAEIATGREDVERGELEAVLERFVGELEQIPPRFSAVRVDGKRAYERARDGEEFDVPSRVVHIHDLQVVDVTPGLARMRVTCGGGTYVRSLARDIAVAVGTVAHARHIRRLQVGPWTIERAITVDRLMDADDARDLVLSPAEMVASLPSWSLDDEQHRRVTHGNSIVAPLADVMEGFVALFDEERLVAVAVVKERTDDGVVLQPRRVIAS